MTTPSAKARRLLADSRTSSNGFAANACVYNRFVHCRRPRPGRETQRLAGFSPVRYNFYTGPCDQQPCAVVLERAAEPVLSRPVAIEASRPQTLVLA